MSVCDVEAILNRLMMLHANGLMYQNHSTTKFNFTIFGIKYNIRCNAITYHWVVWVCSFIQCGMIILNCSETFKYKTVWIFKMNAMAVVVAVVSTMIQTANSNCGSNIRFCGLIFMWAKDDTMHNCASFK